MKKLYPIICCCLSMTYCTGGDESRYLYQFSNQSSQRIAIVMDEIDGTLPDSLVIESGKVYEWYNWEQSSAFIPLRAEGAIKVYYGDDTKAILEPSDERYMMVYGNFVRTEIKRYFYLATYTFTEQDYEDALANASGN